MRRSGLQKEVQRPSKLALGRESESESDRDSSLGLTSFGFIQVLRRISQLQVQPPRI